MQRLVRLFPLILLFLFSCNTIPEGSYSNACIDAEIKAELPGMIDQVMKALYKKEVHALEPLLSDALSEDHDMIHEFVEQRTQQLSSSRYQMVDLYYTKHATGDEKVILESPARPNKYSYTIQYTSRSTESAVAICEPDSPTEGDRQWFMMILSKQEAGWKLETIDLGRHLIAGKTAPDYFDWAKEQDKLGHLTNAINSMVMASATSTPAVDYFKYTIQDSMDAYQNDLLERALANYPMPMEISSLPTHPTLFKVMPQRVEEHLCSMVKYRSVINLEDSVALAAENALLHDQIGEIFKGINQGVPYVFYRAYNEISHEGVSVPYYGFVRETKTKLSR